MYTDRAGQQDGDGQLKPLFHMSVSGTVLHTYLAMDMNGSG
jgi:hypothetical protein